jgi:alpha-ketoglutarate-dependent taurine dioxygenase
MAMLSEATRPSARLGADIRAEPYGSGGGLPVFLSPRNPLLAQDLDAVLGWIDEQREALDLLVDTAGAVVLRGFPFTDTAAFSQLVARYPDMEFGYSGGATTRGVIAGRVFEATRSPPDFRIMLHQEMAYLPRYPRRLAFFCAHAPDSGGETIIADVRRFEAALPADFVRTVRERGVRYARNFRSPDWRPPHPVLEPMHKTWTDAFFTEDPRKAEADCLQIGLEHQWEPNGSLSVLYAASGFTQHARDGRTIWFNHIASQTMSDYNFGAERVALFREYYGTHTAWPYQTTYADGGAIPLDKVEALYPILEELAVAFPWRAGDVMLVDNLHTFHGRNAYTGRRDVQVALLG